MARYELAGVGMRYSGTPVLSGVSLAVDGGGLTAIAGPNGAGKSTLLGIMANLRGGYSGVCAYDGLNLERWQRRPFARHVAFVPQSLHLEFPFSAEQVVLMGRTPHATGMFETGDDYAHAEAAMRLTDTLQFRHRDFRSLSGGERQRVVLASALAQSAETLLLDEPTTYLDLEHQVSIYRLLRERARAGSLIVTVTHDLNLAARYADRVLILSEGRLVADGAPADALSPERVAEVFRVPARALQTPEGRPWIVYGD
ncbi:MAG: ABC transporter ATP-binding protein [Bryobacteraceae bacterium]